MDLNSEKKEKLKEQVYQEQMQECSFHPEINQKSRAMAPKEVRNADEFHEDLMRKDQYYKERREQALQEKHDMEKALLSNPKLNPKSQELARKRSPNANVVDRLYASKQPTQLHPSSESSIQGRPEISAKSRKIKRDKPVQDCLYEDALKRRQLQQRTETSQQSQVAPSDNSISWFVQKFIKDFYYELSCLERIQEQKDYSRLTYTETLQLLIGLHFVKTP